MLDQQHGHAEHAGPSQRTQAHAGPCGHQAQRQGSGAQTADRGFKPAWNVKAQQIGHQTADRGNDEGVAHQLAAEVGLRMPRHRPDGGGVEDGHAHADQHGNQQQALGAGQTLGHGQRDEGVETKGDLRAGRMLAAVHACAQPRQVGQQVRQRNAGAGQRQPGGNQSGSGRQVQRAFDNRVKQQDREKNEKDQFFGLLPDRAVQLGVAAHQEAEQDEGEVRDKEFSVVHPARITASCKGKPLCVIHRLMLLWLKL